MSQPDPREPYQPVDPPPWDPRRRGGPGGGGQPALNVPPVVLWLIGSFVAVFFVETILTREMQRDFMYTFGFVPLRFNGVTPELEAIVWLPWDTRWITPFTYAWLHAGTMHLVFNSVWLLAFGTAVARRVGATRFMAIFLITSGAGAAAHYLFHADSFVPVVGASGGISGLMGAAARFFFLRPSNQLFRYGMEAHPPLAPFTHPNVVAFTAVIVILNLLMGFASLDPTGQARMVAIDAHLGGFFAGLLLIGLIDPPRRPTGHF
jgi:membrane associated rhomboid family serine protease